MPIPAGDWPLSGSPSLHLRGVVGPRWDAGPFGRPCSFRPRPNALGGTDPFGPPQIAPARVAITPTSGPLAGLRSVSTLRSWSSAPWILSMRGPAGSREDGRSWPCGGAGGESGVEVGGRRRSAARRLLGRRCVNQKSQAGTLATACVSRACVLSHAGSLLARDRSCNTGAPRDADTGRESIDSQHRSADWARQIFRV